MIRLIVVIRYTVSVVNRLVATLWGYLCVALGPITISVRRWSIKGQLRSFHHFPKNRRLYEKFPFCMF